MARLSRVPAIGKIAGAYEPTGMSPERADALITGAELAASAAKIAMRVVRPTPFIIFKLISVELPLVVSCKKNGGRNRLTGSAGFYSCGLLSVAMRQIECRRYVQSSLAIKLIA